MKLKQTNENTVTGKTLQTIVQICFTYPLGLKQLGTYVKTVSLLPLFVHYVASFHSYFTFLT